MSLMALALDRQLNQPPTLLEDSTDLGCSAWASIVAVLS